MGTQFAIASYPVSLQQTWRAARARKRREAMATRPGRISFPVLLGRTTEQYAQMLEKAELAAQRLMNQVLMDLEALIQDVPELGKFVELSEDKYTLIAQEEHGDETRTD